MFKPEHDRLDYGNILQPPAGYYFESAITTTYSLDLEALTMVAISLGLSEETDSKLAENPIGMLNALQKMSEKIVVFCESGQIKIPNNSTALSLMLEKMIVPVSLPKKKGQTHYAAFHPKTWLLRYANDNGEVKYRFIVLSRNLTFDRSWDISVVLDSSNKVRQVRKTKPIINFIDYLKSYVSNDLQDVQNKRRILRQMTEELPKISFTTDTKEFGENFEILPLGIGDNAYPMTKDILFCDDKGEPNFTFHELVVMSPFISDNIIEFFNDDRKSLKSTKRTLITRKSELSKITREQVTNFNIYTLRDDIVDGEEILSDEDTVKRQQDIHAKIYLRRKYGDVDIYIGSMNASNYALNHNVEMMVWLGTRDKYLNHDKFLSDLFGEDEDNRSNPFELSYPCEPIPDNRKNIEDRLEQVIKTICRCKKKANVEPVLEDKYNVYVTMDVSGLDIDGYDIYIHPFRSKREEKLDSSMKFANLDLLQLSEFYAMRIVKEDISLERLICIPTAGIPEERENAVVNSVVHDKKSFVEYLSFVLEDNFTLASMEVKQMNESGLASQGKEMLPALYEKMLKTALTEPDKLSEIGYLLRMVTDKEIIPEEFRNMYEVFKSTCRIR